MTIEPRSFDQLLAVGVRVLGRVFGPLAGPSFGGAVVLAALSAAAFRDPAAIEFLDTAIQTPETIQAMTPTQLSEAASPFLRAAFLSSVAYLITSGFVALVAARLVATDLAGGQPRALVAVRHATGRFPGLVVAGSIAFLGVAAGSLLVIPGIALAVYLSMLAPAASIDGGTPAEILRTSFQAVRGRWWPTFGFLLAVALMGSLSGQLLQWIALPLLTSGALPLGVGLAFALGAVIQGLIIGAISVMASVWYLDLRSRRPISLDV